MIAAIYDKTTGSILSIAEDCFGDFSRFSTETQDFLIVDQDITDKKVVNGQFVDIAQEELEEKEIQRAWKDLRYVRYIELKSSDWTQVPDAPVDSAAWAVYRQQLRDLPANTTDPRTVEWPVPPS